MFYAHEYFNTSQRKISMLLQSLQLKEIHRKENVQVVMYEG